MSLDIIWEQKKIVWKESMKSITLIDYSCLANEYIIEKKKAVLHSFKLLSIKITLVDGCKKFDLFTVLLIRILFRRVQRTWISSYSL